MRVFIVDGYNVINSVSSYKDLSKKSIDTAISRLIDDVISLTANIGAKALIVFDGKGEGEGNHIAYDRGRVEVIYSRRGETADEHIERIIFSMKGEVEMSLVTSDYLQQKTTFSKNVLRVTPREFWKMVKQRDIESDRKPPSGRRIVEDELEDDVKEVLEKMRRGLI